MIEIGARVAVRTRPIQNRPPRYVVGELVEAPEGFVSVDVGPYVENVSLRVVHAITELKGNYMQATYPDLDPSAAS